MISLHGKKWTQQIDLVPNVWLHSSVGRASHRYRGGHGFESRWSPDFFFRLLLSNCLNWKIYCDDHTSFSSHTAVQIWIISYIFHMISLHGEKWTQQIDLAPNVWLHSSVGRASHRYRGGHGFESRWSPDFFQASFQLLKLENLLRWSHFIFISYRSTNMNYFIYISQSVHSPLHIRISLFSYCFLASVIESCSPCRWMDKDQLSFKLVDGRGA